MASKKVTEIANEIANIKNKITGILMHPMNNQDVNEEERELLRNLLGPIEDMETELTVLL